MLSNSNCFFKKILEVYPEPRIENGIRKEGRSFLVCLVEHFDGNLTAHKLELKNLKFSLSYFVEPTIDYKLGWKLAFESRLEKDDN